MNHNSPPEYPRSEPEIFPAGCDPHPPRGPVGMWVHMDSRDGVHRLYVAQPSTGMILFGALLIGFLAAVALIALAGFVLFWIPVVIGGILLAFAAAAIRRRWWQLRAWWTLRRHD